MDSDREVQSVLRCGLCNKPFNKQATLKRHGYYCRSRRSGPNTRSRSCITCARRKARCDNRRPQCSRCSTKGVECQYPALVQRNQDSDVPSSTTDSTGDSRSSRGGCRDGGVLLADPEVHSGIVNLRLPGEVGDLNWDNYDNGLDLDVGSFEFLNTVLQPNETPVEYQYPMPTSFDAGTVHHSIPNEVQAQQLFSHQMTIPPLQSLPRLLVYRPESNIGTKRATTLILHTLKSYLLMMLHENTLPPFIHPHSLVHPSSLPPNAEVQNKYHSYNPLGNCIALVQTLSTSPKKSRRSFWEHARTECDRLCSADYLVKLSRWELLGAMQALSIYVLIRLDEGETEENNLDFLFLAAVTAVAQELCSSDIASDVMSELCDDDQEVSWKGWIFEESRRRLSIIYRIINMLVYFEPAAKCDLPTDLVLAPLPAKKPLWEATDEVVWKTESERNPRVHQMAFGIAASGSLVRLDKEHGRGEVLHRRDAVLSHTVLDVGIVSRSPADWEEWCSGMDGFGALVMLAASLVV